jgi:hypothetical protein
LLLDPARNKLAGGDLKGGVEMTLAYAAAGVTVLVGVAWSVWAALITGVILVVFCAFAWMTR